ncbi:MAG: DUF2889 domain-containing protein [Bacillota bacterium]
MLLSRTKIITGKELNNGCFLLNAHMKDDEHILDVQLVVSTEGQVVSAYATVGKAPYGKLCAQAIRKVERLVGLKVRHGSAREVTELVGGSTGCTHLVELVLEALRGFVPVMGLREARRLEQSLREAGVPETEIRLKVMDMLWEMGKEVIPGSCLVYSQNESPVSRLRKEELL